MALEALMTECFGLKRLQEGGSEEVEAAQNKEDEKMALESIYGDAFSEKIRGKLWQFEMNIPSLQKLIRVRGLSSENLEKCHMHASEGLLFMLENINLTPNLVKNGRFLSFKKPPLSHFSKFPDDLSAKRSPFNARMQIRSRFYHYPLLTQA